VAKQSFAPGIDPSSGVPLYVQLEERLSARLASKEWPTGSKIPSEEELAAYYGVSRVTMRQAMARLVDKGLIVRGRGRGSFVRDSHFTSSARGVSSFTSEISALGYVPGNRILSMKEVPSDVQVAEAIKLSEGTPVWELMRLRTGDGLPVGVQTTYLPSERFPGLDARVKDETSLYDVLTLQYGMAPIEAVESLSSMAVPASLAGVLDVRRGAPAMYVERTTYDHRGAFEFTKSVMRGDRYRVRIALRNA
jgi:GntR family transcriptional regulator